VEVDWVVLASPGAERATEARASAAAFLAAAGASRIEVHGFRDGFLPYVGAEVKDVFEGMKGIDPQVVFTHSGYDFHQDHRLASELTWNTFRNHLILEYEIPKIDGDIGRPNLFVPLTAEVVEEKLSLLEKHFPTQVGKHWFDRDTFSGLMRLRGMEAVAPERFAEGFTCRKALVGF
jgi:LmbE family N-acetylglucosaminyl deacetylase